MMRSVVLAAVFVAWLAAPAEAQRPSVFLTGQFENLLSRACYPLRVDVLPQSFPRTLRLQGLGLTFYAKDDVTCAGGTIGNNIERLVPTGETLAAEVNMQRDLARDPRVTDIFVIASFNSTDNAIQSVTFADMVPLIVVTPRPRDPAGLDRGRCHGFSGKVFPETIPISITFTSSMTSGEPDLLITAGPCDSAAPSTAIDLPGGREPHNDHFRVQFKIAPGNPGTTGTLTVSSTAIVDGAAFVPVSETFTFKPFVPPPPPPPVQLVGEFENLLSRGCYPVSVIIAPRDEVRVARLAGVGVRFFAPDGDCETGTLGLGTDIDVPVPPGESAVIEAKMQRDLLIDTRIAALVTAGIAIGPMLPGDRVEKPVTFVDPAPLIILQAEAFTGIERDRCFAVDERVFPETIPLTMTFAASATNGVPDLEVHTIDSCLTPSITSLNLPGGRDPDARSFRVSIRRAPENTGTKGRLTVSSSTLVDGVAFTPVSLPFDFAPPPPPPPPPVRLIGQFKNLLSRGCHPVRLEVDAKPEARTFSLDGAGVTFYPRDSQCDVPTIGNSLDGEIPPNTPLVLEVNMQRDLQNDTRVAAALVATAGTDSALADVSFADPAPLIVFTPLFTGTTNLERNKCYFFAGRVFPENIPVTMNFASSLTKTIPDLEIHGNGCDTPVLPTLELPVRDPDDTHFVASFKRAPKNAGTTGTLTVSSPTVVDGVAFTPVVKSYTFKPRATLSLTAGMTTNLPPNACVPATVRVGSFDFPSIRVRVYSGTGNARVYSSSGCLTTLSEVTLPPGGSRTVWLKTVAPDQLYASLIADTSGVPNVEPTRPPSAGLTFYFALP
jgi:hypothetical protein